MESFMDHINNLYGPNYILMDIKMTRTYKYQNSMYKEIQVLRKSKCHTIFRTRDKTLDNPGLEIIWWGEPIDRSDNRVYDITKIYYLPNELILIIKTDKNTKIMIRSSQTLFKMIDN